MKRLVLEGEMTIWSQEGGYAAPDVSIDNKSVTGDIWDFFKEFESATMHGEIGDVPGRWRIIVEEVTT